MAIEQLERRVRRISSRCLVASSVQDVWGVLTDYDRLHEHVPNLVVSRLVPHPDPGGIRLFQVGSQSIAGFKFGAAVTLDMREERGGQTDRQHTMAVGFSLVESKMFQEFEGEWRLRSSDVARPAAEGRGEDNFTELSYTVTIRPKGLVPVAALEWRIREDLPVNMLAMKAAAEAVAERRGEHSTDHSADSGESGAGA